MFAALLTFIVAVVATAMSAIAAPLEFVRPSDDGAGFVAGEGARPVVLWGVNYDHDGGGRLLEDYWRDEWSTVVEDVREIAALGCNCVRIHLQLGRFMDAADRPNEEHLARLRQLIDLAEEQGVYLILTGLGCYHRADVPAWYDGLSEAERWRAQAAFWRAVARVGRDSPAVLAYDLMNEPVLPGEKAEAEWLAPPLGDKHYVQRIALDLAGRGREELANAWVATLAAAIRAEDTRHMITVGVIPWAHYFPGAKPLFYSAEAGGPLDFVSVHFYPKAGEVTAALDALRTYELGKPLVVEEVFPLACSSAEALEFIERSKPIADGWISFYWGQPAEECQRRGDLGGALTAAWLREFAAKSPLSESVD